jgi:hypothetical protein
MRGIMLGNGLLDAAVHIVVPGWLKPIRRDSGDALKRTLALPSQPLAASTVTVFPPPHPV